MDTLARSIDGGDELRSSPTLEGRCCRLPPGRDAGLLLRRLRSSPTLEGRCCPRRRGRPLPSNQGGCDPHRPWRAGAAPAVEVVRYRPTKEVAILTDPGGPVLPSPPSPSTTCSPKWLRSSPTLEGRCCWEMHRDPVAQGDGVAILTDPGGPVLPWCDAQPRWPSTRCDPHRPWRAGAARRLMPATDGALKVLRSSPTLEGRCCPHGWNASSSRGSRLRSSPTLEGRCCAQDPHRGR